MIFMKKRDGIEVNIIYETKFIPFIRNGKWWMECIGKYLSEKN